MIFLTDAPERFPWEPDGPLCWNRGAAPEPALQAWDCLGKGRDLFWAETGTPADDQWPLLVVVGKASGSQMDALTAALRANRPLPPRLAALALEGSGFHGQHHRPWKALPGNLHLSILDNPGFPVREAGVGYTLLPVLAAADLLTELHVSPSRFGIKWVNDLLLDERKVAGALTRTEVQEGRVEKVVLGLGLNLRAAPSLPQPNFVPGAVALTRALPESETKLSDIWPRLLRHFGRRLDQLHQQGLPPLLTAYREASLCLGRKVAIWLEDALPPEPPHRQGRVLAIGDDLGLELDDGRERVLRGRLTLSGS